MIKRATKKLSGGMLLGVGLVFGVLPFVPGIVLILAGLELLGLREALVSRLKNFRKTPSVEAPVVLRDIHLA